MPPVKTRSRATGMARSVDGLLRSRSVAVPPKHLATLASLILASCLVTSLMTHRLLQGSIHGGRLRRMDVANVMRAKAPEDGANFFGAEEPSSISTRGRSKSNVQWHESSPDMVDATARQSDEPIVQNLAAPEIATESDSIGYKRPVGRERRWEVSSPNENEISAQNDESIGHKSAVGSMLRSEDVPSPDEIAVESDKSTTHKRSEDAPGEISVQSDGSISQKRTASPDEITVQIDETVGQNRVAGTGHRLKDISSSGEVALQSDKSISRKLASSSVRSSEDVGTESVSLRERLWERSREAVQRVREQLPAQPAAPAHPPPLRHHPRPRNPGEKTDLSCRGEDAFLGVPVDGAGSGWAPPGGHPLESVQKWEREYQAAVRRIREARLGGSELREFSAREVRRLRRLRHELFLRRRS